MLIINNKIIPKLPWGLKITDSYFDDSTGRNPVIYLLARGKESTMFFEWDGISTNFDRIYSKPNVEILPDVE